MCVVYFICVCVNVFSSFVCQTQAESFDPGNTFQGLKDTMYYQRIMEHNIRCIRDNVDDAVSDEKCVPLKNYLINYFP